MPYFFRMTRRSDDDSRTFGVNREIGRLVDTDPNGHATFIQKGIAAKWVVSGCAGARFGVAIRVAIRGALAALASIGRWPYAYFIPQQAALGDPSIVQRAAQSFGIGQPGRAGRIRIRLLTGRSQNREQEKSYKSHMGLPRGMARLHLELRLFVRRR